MAFVDKSYLKTQFDNFATRLSSVFAKKSTTLSGYGITDAKISDGKITLGSASITPLTSHQDISGKQDKLTAGTNITISGTTISAKDTIYGVATTSVNGLMSSGDKKRADVSGNLVYGSCATAAATQAKAITLDNSNTVLRDGDILSVKFTNSNSFSATSSAKITFIIDSVAYDVYPYNNTSQSTGTNTSLYGYANRSIEYRVDVTNKRLHFYGKQWDNNTTYTNWSLGQGYMSCTTAEATTAKVVTASSYALTTGGVCTIKFTYAVPANSTLNINSKGAKNIYYRGAKITNGVIQAGDTATFIYDGTQYQLISIDAPSTIISSTEPSSPPNGTVWIAI